MCRICWAHAAMEFDVSFGMDGADTMGLPGAKVIVI